MSKHAKSYSKAKSPVRSVGSAEGAPVRPAFANHGSAPARAIQGNASHGTAKGGMGRKVC